MVSFREKIFEIVKKIPEGKVLTYKMVAETAGSPRAWRAVGNILNKNPNLHSPELSKKTLTSKTIPCHRVIKSNGKIGGYKYGTKRKTSLLKKEGVIIKNGWTAVT